MENHEWNALHERATRLVTEVCDAAGFEAAVSIEWVSATPLSLYRVIQKPPTISLSRDAVDGWFQTLPEAQAEARFAGLTLRATSALLAGPPEPEWTEAINDHVRSEMAQGLDATYQQAFDAAAAILESHRLDQRVLDLAPDAGDRLAELVRHDLEAHPTFDVYPRAAIVIGRPNLPTDLAQPAFDEFVEEFGVDEADELLTTLHAYVTLPPDAVDAMLDATAHLVFQAFPEAVGLSHGDPTGSDVWPLQGSFPENSGVTWPEIEAFVGATLSKFAGAAGLDFGDALLLGLTGDPLSGSRLGAWSASDAISLDLTLTDFSDESIRDLIGRGWEQFGNAPESFHKSVATGDAPKVAAEFVWILQALAGLQTPDGLEIWGRGPAEVEAQNAGWELGAPAPDGFESLVAYPDTWEDLALLVVVSLAALPESHPEEYEPGRFLLDVDGLEIAVLATEREFPAVRIHHKVLDVPEHLRDALIEFANSLHGRSSTIGSHWWLGGESFWQVCEFWAAKFDQEIFADQLQTFINVARDRTPEIRARFSPEVTDSPPTEDEEFGLRGVGDETEESRRAVGGIFADVGLLVPPLGPFEIEDVQALGPWHWGTYELVPNEMYMFDVDSVASAILNEGQLFALSHAGHGLNSYGLNLVTVGGPFAVFVQHGYGGVYTDPLKARLRINEAYTYLHILLEAEAVPDATNPKWLLLYSEFRGTCGIVDLDEVRAGKSWQESFAPFRDFKSLIRGAVALVPDEEFIASGVSIDWGSDGPSDESSGD